MKKLNGLIYRDCARVMTIPLLINLFADLTMNLANLFTAVIIGSFADAVFDMNASYALENLWRLLICLAVTIFAVPAIRLTCNVFMLKGALSHDRIISGRFLDKEYSEAMKIDAGEAQYRLENDPNAFRYYWMQVTTNFITIPIMTIFLLYNALKINAFLCIVTFSVSLVKLLLPFVIRKLEAKYDLQNREYNASIRACETEITTKPHIIRLFGLSNVFCTRLDDRFKSYYSNTLKKDIACKNISSNISTFVDTMSIITILLIGAVMAAKDTVSAGSVAAMIGYASVFDGILYNISFNIRKLPVVKNLAERLLVFYTGREKAEGKSISPEATISIEADNLCFSYAGTDNNGANNYETDYDGAVQVLDNVAFELTEKDKIAICGANGSGKSTLIKVITGLVKGYTGNVKICGAELKDIAIDTWRAKLAFAMQDPYLFPGTVADNVRLGNLNASDDELNKVMEQVGIFHLKDREIDVAANDLSGGEKQRISIARALIKNTPLLILDEPNNNLDMEGQEWLRKFIRDCGKTVLFISHDDVLTACANKVVRL